MSDRATPLARPDLPDFDAMRTDIVAEHGRAPRSASTYTANARLFVDWATRTYQPHRPLADLEAEDVRGYLRDLYNRGMSTSYRRLAVYSIRWLYRWLDRDQQSGHNPAEAVKVPTQDKPTTDYYTPEQFTQMLDSALTDAHRAQASALDRAWLRSRFEHALLATLRYTGIRLDELIHLRIADIDFDQQHLTVRCGKGGKPREVPLARPLLAILAAYLADIRPRCPASPWLWSNPYGYTTGAAYGHIAVRATFDIVRKHGIAAGIPGRHHPHRLRHGLATEFARRKVDPEQLRMMLGHSDLSTLGRYLHLDNLDVADTVRELYNNDPTPALDGAGETGPEPDDSDDEGDQAA